MWKVNKDAKAHIAFAKVRWANNKKIENRYNKHVILIRLHWYAIYWWILSHGDVTQAYFRLENQFMVTKHLIP